MMEVEQSGHRWEAPAPRRLPRRATDRIEDAAVAPAVDGLSLPRPVQVPARWTGRDGVERRGTVTVGDPLPAGTGVATWVDSAGRPVPPPPTASAAWAVAVLGGIGTALAGWALLGAVWWGVRRWIGLRNAEQWAGGWERVEPEWTGPLTT